MFTAEALIGTSDNEKTLECTSESLEWPHPCIVHATNRVTAWLLSAGSETPFNSAARNTHGTTFLAWPETLRKCGLFSRKTLSRHPHYATIRLDVCGGKESCRIREDRMRTASGRNSRGTPVQRRNNPRDTLIKLPKLRGMDFEVRVRSPK